MRASIDVTVEIEIARAPAAVWSFLADAERAPEWLAEFESSHVTSQGPVGIGSIVEYTIEPGHRSGTYEIVEWDPERRLAWDGPPLSWVGGGARPRGSFELSEVAPGRTAFVARFQPELSGTQVLLRPYLKRWLRRHRLADVQSLRALIEAGP